MKKSLKFWKKIKPRRNDLEVYFQYKRKYLPTGTSKFGLPASRTMREYISVVGSHPVCGHFYTDLVSFRERGRKGEREGEQHQCDTLISCLLHIPNWGPGPQPRHVPWLGIKPVTLWFTGQHSIHWATPAKAVVIFNSSPRKFAQPCPPPPPHWAMASPHQGHPGL